MMNQKEVMTMYRTDLVKQVARRTGLNQRVVSDVLRASQQLVAQTLAAGESVTIPGFGSFYVREQAEGTIRHIQTGQATRIPAHRVAAFRVGAVLKRAVRDRRRRARWW
jgi:DNA-binding protein HU-beta